MCVFKLNLPQTYCRLTVVCIFIKLYLSDFELLLQKRASLGKILLALEHKACNFNSLPWGPINQGPVARK